jgi:hypothetical protein
VTDQPRHPDSHPGARRPPLPAARRALAPLGALLPSLAAAAPAASATLPPSEPPPGPAPLPSAVPAPGLPLWAVLVIIGGAIALSAATTLITLALHPTPRCRRPPSPARTQAKARHQPPPPARPPPGNTPAQPPRPGPRSAMYAGRAPRAPAHARRPRLIPSPAAQAADGTKPCGQER